MAARFVWGKWGWIRHREKKLISFWLFGRFITVHWGPLSDYIEVE